MHTANDPSAAVGTSAAFPAVGSQIAAVLAAQPASDRERYRAEPQVGWERVTLFPHGLSFPGITRGLAELLGYVWERREGGDGVTRRTLIRDERIRRREQDLWERTLRAAMAPLLAIAQYASRPASEFADLVDAPPGGRADDPLLANNNAWRLSRPQPRAGLQLLTTLAPSQLLELAAEGRYLLPWRRMDDRQRRLARAFVAGGFGVDFAGVSEKDFTWLERGGALLEVMAHPVTGAVSQYDVAAAGSRACCASLSPPREGMWVLPVRGRPYIGSVPENHGRYHTLEEAHFPGRFRLNLSEGAPWQEVMRAISECVETPIYSDHYSTVSHPDDRSGGRIPDPGGLDLAAGLDALCRYYGRLWWSKDGALFFRSRTWFIERLFEPPPPLVASVQEELAAAGRLSPRTLTQMARLTTRQLHGLCDATVGDLGRAGPAALVRQRNFGDVRAAHHYLRIYAMLDDRQKEVALSPAGLPVAAMPSHVREEFLRSLLVMYGQLEPDALPHPGLWIRQATVDRMERSRRTRVAVLSISDTDPLRIVARLGIRYRAAAPK